MSLKIIALIKGININRTGTGCHILRIVIPVNWRICESKEVGRKNFNKNFLACTFFIDHI